MTVNSIFKYQLETTDYQEVITPKNAKLLTVQMQRGMPCLWAQVDTSQTERESHQIRVYGTGHPVEEDPGVYLGTYQVRDGTLVFHVYQQSVEPM